MASTIATLRLAATARTTGRGALRNWRQRTSAHERRGGSVDGIAPAGHPSPRIVRTRRGGSVSGVCAASSSTAAAKRSSSSSEVKKPTLIRSASRRRSSGRSRRPATRARRGRPVAGQPAIRNVTRVAIAWAGVRTVTPGIAARRVAAAAASRGPAPIDEVEPDVHRQPADRAGHPDDRRPVEAAAIRTGARRATRRRRRSAVEPLEAEPAGERRDEVARPATGRRRARPSPPGRAATSGPATAYRSAPRLIEAERDRAGGLGAVDDDEGAARVGDLGDPGDRQDRARSSTGRARSRRAGCRR